MGHRKERVASLIQERAAQFLELHLDVDAIVTVTGIDVSPDFRRARILVSVLPDDKEKEVFEEFKGLKSQFAKFMKAGFEMKYLPRFEFVIDKGEKARQRVEDILRELE